MLIYIQTQYITTRMAVTHNYMRRRRCMFCVCASVFVCMYIYIYVCMYVCICMYVHGLYAA